MRRAWIVAQHEFLSNVRRRSFLFASFGVPLLIIGAIVLVYAIAIETETDSGRIGTVGYVDQAGVLADARQQPANFAPFGDDDTARQALAADEIGAYFVLLDDYLATGEVRLYSTAGVPEAVQDEIEEFLRANLGAQLGDAALVGRIVNPVDLSILTLDTGRRLQQEAFVGLFLLPLLFIFIIMIASQTTSGYLMSGVVEEKTNRLMEILITSVRPIDLLVGKVVGLGALGLVQLLIWFTMGSIGLRLGQSSEFLSGVQIPLDLVLVALLYFILSYVLYAGFSAGIGVVVGSEQESRQLAGFFSFMMAVPFFFIVNFITDPNGPIPVALTLFPLTAPVTVLMRMGFGVVPAWQLAASIGILLLTTVIVIWASARVFRWALLMYGKRPGPRDVWRAIRRAPQPGVEFSQERSV